MYVVKIINGNTEEYIHENDQNSMRRLAACTYSDGINYIQEAQFVILSTNPAYNNLHELTTLVKIINTKNNKVVFDGRVEKIYNNGMDAKGMISKTVSCEGCMAYLCDTIQMYGIIPDPEQVQSLSPILSLKALIDRHNNAVDNDKKFDVTGNMTTTPALSYTTDYRNTLETIKKFILEPAGGELYLDHVRDSNNKLVLHYDSMYNNVEKNTVIDLAHNMISFSQETDVSHIVTRLVPLGAYREVEYTDSKNRKHKKKSKERFDIYHADVLTPDPPTSTLSHSYHSFYLDDVAAIEKYGIISSTVIFDDYVNRDDTQEHREEDATALMNAAKAYLLNNNRIRKSYKAEILDLSTIGLDPDELEIGASYRFRNKLIPIGENQEEIENGVFLRLNKITVDIFNAHRPKVEIGEKTEKITSVTARQAQLLEYELPDQEFDLLEAARETATLSLETATQGQVYIEEGDYYAVPPVAGEILIMDHPDKSSATRVWKWNLGGFGYSPNGYSGPYISALTVDGTAVHKFIMSEDILAQNLTITGGKIDMQSSDQSYDLIHLRYTGTSSGTTYSGYTKMQPWRFEVGETNTTSNRVVVTFTGVYGYYGSQETDRSFTLDIENGVFQSRGNRSYGDGRDDNWVSVKSIGITGYAGSDPATYWRFDLDSETGNITSKGTVQGESLIYKGTDSNYHNVGTMMEAAYKNIQTLWNAVFGNGQ